MNLKGKLNTGTVTHDLSLGVLASKVRNRFNRQAFNYVGTGNVQGTAVVPADPTLTDESTHRDEKSLELSLQDAIRYFDQNLNYLNGDLGLSQQPSRIIDAVTGVVIRD